MGPGDFGEEVSKLNRPLRPVFSVTLSPQTDNAVLYISLAG